MQLIPVLLFLIFVAVVFGNVVSFFRSHGNWTQSFEKVATRYGGWFSGARVTRPPAATFNYKSAQVRIKCKRRRREAGTPETEFRIAWPDKWMKMEIVPKSRLPFNRSLRGVATVPTGDEAFDNDWSIYVARGTEQVRKMMSGGVRWQIAQLENFISPVPVHVSIEKNWLVVRKKCFIKVPQVLDDYVRFCLELFDQLTLTMTEGIEFQEDMVISAVTDVRCPICSSDIDGKMVICVRCKTPHCLDCWQYNVKCGMYACDETRYAVVGGD